ncbi:MAG: hypothetical protein GEU80_07770 [Dehalococcoidia bacterium]|nr:hypothetical protein [Dehalococcoidia bacterium]
MHQPDFSPEQRSNFLQRVTAHPVGRLILLGAALALTLSVLTTMAEAAGLVGGTPFGRLVGNNSSHPLMVSNNADRSGASGLDGASLSGDVYIFVTPTEGIRQVRFYLDDQERAGSPRQVENVAPYDFAATADDEEAHAFDADGLVDGEHTVTAEVETMDGEVALAAATFTVGVVERAMAQVTSGGEFPLLVSRSEDRSGSELLDGSTQDGQIFVFIEPQGVKRVYFFLDNADQSGSAFQTENHSPYDFAGTVDGTGSARAFDASALSSGEHTISARVETSDGASVVTSATFSVGEGGAPSPSATPSGSPTATATSAPGSQEGSGDGSDWGLALSQASNRSTPSGLDGATVSGEIFVFIAPDSGIGRVRFFVDDPDRKGSPYLTEYQPAYDLAGTLGGGRAAPFDADQLGAGSHTVTAEIDRKSGGMEVIHTTFTVGGSDGGSGGDTPDGTPTATPIGIPTSGGQQPSVSGSAPNGAVEVRPGDNVQSMVNSKPGGTTFYLAAGVHRMQSVAPKDGNTFIGAPGAAMRGSRELSSWDRAGSNWVIGGQTQEGRRVGACEFLPNGQRDTMCVYPEQLFIDGERLTQVGSLSQLGSGKWYFDYGRDRIYIADNPSGRLVETSVTDMAFYGNARNVTIRGLVIEQYASPAQVGALQGKDGSGWVVDGNIVQYNHGVGIRTGTGMQVLNNTVLHQGQIGITGAGSDVVVQGNEIAYNNESFYKPRWEAGGTKFVKTRNLVVRDNYVHHNTGPGIWTDIDNVHTLFEGNRVEYNTGQGIKHEISYDAIIRGNTARFNGTNHDVWLWGAQILVQNSPNVEVYNNTVVAGESAGDGIAGVNQDRGTGSHGKWELRNLWVHDNDITYLGNGQNSGVAGNCGDNNRFSGNTYRAPRDYQDKNWWEWCGRTSFGGLQKIGQEAGGNLLTN